MNKREVLEKSIELITGDREEDYGEAIVNFSRIADLWSVVLGSKVQPWQVAACMMQVKIARAIKSPQHVDSWIDLCGYGALAAELALTTPLAEWGLELLRSNRGEAAAATASQDDLVAGLLGVEDLEGLPDGSRVRDREGDLWEKYENGGWGFRHLEPGTSFLIENFAPYTLVRRGFAFA